MGRKKREKIARIEAGLEPSIASQIVRPLRIRWLTCKRCNRVIEELRAREHIRGCWNYPIKDDEPILSEPIVPTVGALGGKK